MRPELVNLGLSQFFIQQLTTDEVEHNALARVVSVQRSQLRVSDGASQWAFTLGSHWFEKRAEQRPTVGDWLLLEAGGEKVIRLLDRKSLFKRVAAGSKVELQLIAANVDTLFIVTSCNNDFKESRLERYLALALEAGADPVFILTKADLCEAPDIYRERAMAVSATVPVEMVNSLQADTLQGASAWLSKGSTVALVGSSGVGKSTLVNTMSGDKLADTASIREQDAKGRHTTSYRSLHLLPGGGLLLDVPGMRELKVADVNAALTDVFADVEQFAGQCRFRDCQHNEEPGCAVRSALESGNLDSRRLSNFKKLRREDARNSASIAEQRRQERQFGNAIKQILELKNDGKRSQ